MNPSIVGSQAFGLVSDILHIETHTVVELSFKELGSKKTHTHTHREGHERQRPTKIHFDEVMTTFVCNHFFHAAFEVIS